MKCSNCGNDLLVEVAPTGAGKLLSMFSISSYTCVRCGKTTTVVLSKTRAALLCLLVASALGLGILFAMDQARQSPHPSVRLQVDSASTSAPRAASATNNTMVTTLPQEGEAAPAAPGEKHPPAAEARTDRPSHDAEAARDDANQDHPGPETETQKPSGHASADDEGSVPPVSQDAPTPAVPTVEQTPPADAAQQSANALASPPDQNATRKDSAKAGMTGSQAGDTSAPSEAEPPSTAPEPDGRQATAPQAPALPEPPLEEIKVTAPPKPRRPSDAGNAQPAATTARGSATLLSVRTGQWNDALVIHLGVSGSVNAPTGFALASPPRYVVDIPGSWTYKGERTITVGDALATALRIGLHDDKLRVVVDLSRAPQKASARRDDGSVVITIR